MDTAMFRELQPDEQSEREWIAAARAGDTEAFRRLVERYQARLFTFLLRMVRQREEAEDLAQEAFVRAWRHLGRYDDRWPFRVWLFRIGRNLALNSLRRPGARIVSIDAMAASDGPPTEPAAVGPLPSEQAAASQRSRRIARAIRSLPARAATIVTLFYQEDMQIGDIADTLGMSAGAVKVALHRARAALRKML